MTGDKPAFHFDLEWRIALATVLLVPLFIGLGFWQRDRAAEKTALAAAWELRQQQAPVSLRTLQGRPSVELAYRPVRLMGEFLPEAQFLLDNRIYQGRYGNEILSVLRLAGSEHLVLVNRGWISADPGRQSLPDAPPPAGQVTLDGHLYVPPGDPYLLAEQVLEPGWPKRIQAVQIPVLAAALAADTVVDEPGGPQLFPYTVRIRADQPGALTVDWQVINVSPAKHLGYSVQWFAMALALALVFLFRSSNLWSVLTGRKGAEVVPTNRTGH